MNLRELSAVLGLSQTTVSRALNGFPEVSEETRARVRAAAELHGYRPSAAARRPLRLLLFRRRECGGGICCRCTCRG